MGCICAEPRKTRGNLDIFKDCDKSEGIKSEAGLFETYSPDLKPKSDVSLVKSTKTFSLTPETTDMKQNVDDFNLVLEREVTLERSTPGKNRSTKLQYDRIVLSDVYLPELKPVESDKTYSAKLAKAKKHLEQLESRSKRKKEEVKNLRAENYRLKDRAKLKAAQISVKSSTRKERHSSMRRRREEIEKSSPITQKIFRKNTSLSSKEKQEHELEPRISITQVSELHEISRKKEQSLQWRNTPRESLPPLKLVETQSSWTFSEPTVLQ